MYLLINKVCWKFVSGAKIYVQFIHPVRLFLGIYPNKIMCNKKV